MHRRFNTSGVNDPAKHYTLKRESLVRTGMQLVAEERYFTIWAPRQTGKTTYFELLRIALIAKGYKVAAINFEDFGQTPLETFLRSLVSGLNKGWNTELECTNISDIFLEIEAIKDQKLVLIIDEVEGINKDYFSNFLHAIRRVYHSRSEHGLKSVILVGVSNIVGIIQDNASPFNITENLQVPFFTTTETMELLEQHERATGQLFDIRVKEKIAEITANQPGLVNGFAQQLITIFKQKPTITYDDYLVVEDWYLNLSIDKNVSNILNKAQTYRAFVEQLLFTAARILFQIDRPAIKALHTNGLIKRDDEGYVIFWVPLYQKKLYNAFYPYTNGEASHISSTMLASAYLTKEGKIDFDKLIEKYKKHIKARSFHPYREKDKNGKFKSIREAAMLYSFETFISIFLQEIEGTSYREAFVSLGNVDLIINVKGVEYLIETKRYYSPRKFKQGKRQLAYYCNRKGISEGIYIVFIEKAIEMDFIREEVEEIEEVTIKTYLIRYDEATDFGEPQEEIL